jgi:hypothetical protein
MDRPEPSSGERDLTMTAFSQAASGRTERVRLLNGLLRCQRLGGQVV